MSQERDRVLGHADDNDGIDEYDNQLPPWWTFMFFFTVVWGIGYAVDYHFISKRSQAASYEAEMLAAAEQWPEQESAALAGPAHTFALSVTLVVVITQLLPSAAGELGVLGIILFGLAAVLPGLAERLAARSQARVGLANVELGFLGLAARPERLARGQRRSDGRHDMGGEVQNCGLTER